MARSLDGQPPSTPELETEILSLAPSEPATLRPGSFPETRCAGEPLANRHASGKTPDMVRTIPRGEWTRALDGFTQRNAGRHTSLEVKAPGIGTRPQQRHFQLQGVVFDPKDERIEIMLGGFEGVGPHLTHTVGDVEAIDLLTDSTGRDTVLRIAQRTGHTLLRIEV